MNEFTIQISIFKIFVGQATQRVAAQKTKEDVRKVKAASVKLGDPFAMGGTSKYLFPSFLNHGYLCFNYVTW